VILGSMVGAALCSDKMRWRLQQIQDDDVVMVVRAVDQQLNELFVSSSRMYQRLMRL